ncbi:30S ribosomal protein S8 [Candidatus Woesearchaeota archaeon]|nr:30S ribosomal protein S8 [Candidatus Woesearchaeota archaeon]MBI2130931.1 30S ribosomal protein S8 [Candidatus Woesearchaeota archaeon]MBI2661348.1 30S ribosomal protein S8 [Candidatus Woesearchaeota archaeon]
MTANDILSNALSLMLNNERIGRADCLIRPVSRLIKDVLGILKQNGYVAEFTETDDGKGKYIELKLSGTINKCGVIKPRFNAKMKDFEKFERRYLPARDMGIIIISTHLGVMTHKDAKKKNLGGKLLAYCY